MFMLLQCAQCRAVCSVMTTKQPGDWVHPSFINNSSATQLYVWALFHSQARYGSQSKLQPVPPVPPMVLQMLNQSSTKLCWALDVDAGTQRASFAETTSGKRFLVPLMELFQPNWWRNFLLTGDPDPVWFAALPLRIRRVTALRPVTSVTYLADSRSLVDLDLSETEVTSEGLEGLGRIPTLAKVNLSSCQDITSVTCLRGSKSIVYLDLSASGITSEGLEGLAQIPTLKKLNLSSCQDITSVACLGASKSIVDLDLSGTFMTPEFLEGLECTPTLTKLNLNSCRDITSVSCLGASKSIVDLDLSLTYMEGGEFPHN